MQLYKWEDKDYPYNNFKIFLELPVFRKSSFYDDLADGFYKTIRISFDTAFDFRHSHDHWMIKVAVFGFGFGMVRQTGY